MGVRGRSIVAALCAAVLVPVAHAATAGPADEAAAARATLRLSDLPAIGRWTSSTALSSGGAGASVGGRCAGLASGGEAAVTGHASSEFATAGADVKSDVTMLSSAPRLDRLWTHSPAPAVLRCLRNAFTGATGSAEVLSLRQLRFPAIAPHAAAFRVVYGARLNGKPYRGALDLVLLAGGRTQILLSLVAELGTPAQAPAGEAAMSALDEQLARAVVGRALPPSA